MMNIWAVAGLAYGHPMARRFDLAQRVRQHHDGGANRRRNKADQNIAMPHVGKLVGDDSLELVFVQETKESFGRGHRCVLGVAAGRKRVGGLVWDDIDAWHRELCAPSKTSRHLMERMIRAYPRWPDTSARRPCPRTNTSQSS